LWRSRNSSIDLLDRHGFEVCAPKVSIRDAKLGRSVRRQANEVRAVLDAKEVHARRSGPDDTELADAGTDVENAR
jgi:hypothetical protein